ncbi:hypothetical protein TNCT_437211 [Trichonephila clavata]|uniref:Uncharacterized protein n=1 Tax=Trichonephila clavata TaxID=2740835 RepID=A0A8X6G854_TRICU|nr:hypothetical protein TNCT_437211 [Trichonephila clavata]
MSDVVSGSSLKDSARSRFRETSKKIKDDIMHKIQSGSGKKKEIHKENHSHRVKRNRKRRKKQTYSRSNMDSRACACVKSELDLFNVNPCNYQQKTAHLRRFFLLHL